MKNDLYSAAIAVILICTGLVAIFIPSFIDKLIIQVLGGMSVVLGISKASGLIKAYKGKKVINEYLDKD